MIYHNTIFSVKKVRQAVENRINFEIPDLNSKLQIVENWKKNLVNGKYIQAKEEEIRPIFLTDFFERILGYVGGGEQDWNFRLENRTETDNSKADAALGFFRFRDQEELPKDVRVVIEIKDARTALDKPQYRKDFKGSAVEQAFMYAAKTGERCKWVIVSNFLEIRLYQANDMSKYERFDVLALTDPYEFRRFYYLLCYGNLFQKNTNSIIDTMLEERQEIEKKITKTFYAEYRTVRELFYYHLQENNPQIPSLDLLDYAQTILDRIIFIAVVKDYDLLPSKALRELEDIAQKSWATTETELWRQLKLFFAALDKGYSGHKTLQQFNGGLFRHQPEIDALIVKDSFLQKELLRLADYDFESDLNINILGHIFEQSISDIEEFKKNITSGTAEAYFQANYSLEAQQAKNQSSQRKRDGIYYTPTVITDYINKMTIGAWMENLKLSLGLNEAEKLHPADQIQKWEEYSNQLKNIKILDPACGSGAFLSQAFDFLLAEWQMIYDVMTKLQRDTPLVQDGLFIGSSPIQNDQIALIKKHIVSQNLYGVDLNNASVEITKLGLWLKSATKNDSLASLDGNIRCGNSLISDKALSQKAFDWQNAFPEVWQKGGFDVIIGNPPYVSAANMSFDERQYFNQTTDYKTLIGRWDLFIPFIEKSLTLLKKQGYFSFIVPYGLLNQPFASKLRKLILDEYNLIAIIDLHQVKIFEQATVPTCIPFIQNSPANPEQFINILQFANNEFFISHQTPITHFQTAEQHMFRTERMDNTTNLMLKMKDIGNPLSEFFYVSTGAEIHGKEQRTESGELLSGFSKFDLLHTQKTRGFKPYIEGADIPKSRTLGRYSYPQIKLWLDYDDNVGRMRSPKFKELFENEKIMVRGSSGLMYILATLDRRNIYTSHKTTIIISRNQLPAEHAAYLPHTPLSLSYLLGILNSKLMHLFYGSIYGGFIDVYPNYLKDLPIPQQVSPQLQSSLAEKVDQMLSLHEELSNCSHRFLNLIKGSLQLAKLPEKFHLWYEMDWLSLSGEFKKSKTKITKKELMELSSLFEEQKQEFNASFNYIAKLDAQIDQLVYQCYGLDAAEIALVEQQYQTQNRL